MPNVFLVPNTDAGNLTATPTSQSVTLGNPASVTLNWSGLASGRWLGIVNYNDGTNAIGSTLVSVDNPKRQQDARFGPAPLRWSRAEPASFLDGPAWIRTRDQRIMSPLL